MKNYSIILLIFLIFACKKDNDLNKNSSPSSSSIINLWEAKISYEYIYTNDSLVSGDTASFPPNEVWIKFNADSTYIEYENKIPVDSAAYLYNNDMLSFISGTDTMKYTATLTFNTLTLQNIQVDFSNLPDTTVFETKIVFKRL